MSKAEGEAVLSFLKAISRGVEAYKKIKNTEEENKLLVYDFDLKQWRYRLIYDDSLLTGFVEGVTLLIFPSRKPKKMNGMFECIYDPYLSFFVSHYDWRLHTPLEQPEPEPLKPKSIDDRVNGTNYMYVFLNPPEWWGSDRPYKIMDARKGLSELPDCVVDCCITSPPPLRDYHADTPNNREPHYDQFVSHLCDIFDEVKRVLKPTGTCFVNLGDTYGGSGDATLLMTPFRFAIEMVNRGWTLRSVIIWYDSVVPNPVQDRFTPSFEYIFFFVKSNKPKFWTNKRTMRTVTKSPPGINGIEDIDWEWREIRGTIKKRSLWSGHKYYYEQQFEPTTDHSAMRNKRAVWRINPGNYYEGEHFAAFPLDLPKNTINPGCPRYICRKCGKPRLMILKGMGYSKCDCCDISYAPGIVLDPFLGSGTTIKAANDLGRIGLGFEINPDYEKTIVKRIAVTDYIRGCPTETIDDIWECQIPTYIKCVGIYASAVLYKPIAKRLSIPIKRHSWESHVNFIFQFKYNSHSRTWYIYSPTFGRELKYKMSKADGEAVLSFLKAISRGMKAYEKSSFGAN